MAAAAPCRLFSQGLHWSDLHFPLLDLVPPDISDNAAKVCVFNKGTEAIIVTLQDDVYVIGNNINNCLGMSYLKTTPPVAVKNPELSGKNICQIVACTNATCVVANTMDGQVYSWGQNAVPVLGNGQNGAKPSLVEFGDGVTIVQLACGESHVLALDGNGQVFGWGQNAYYQVGTGNNQPQARPVRVITNSKVSSITCGTLSSAAVSVGGEVALWGCNDQGFLCTGSTNTPTVPTIVGALQGKKIVQVAMSRMHTLCLTEDGAIYACGHNGNGQLGDGTITAIYTPKLITGNNVFKEIAVAPGGVTSAGLLANGQVCVWGHCWQQSLTTPTNTYFSSIYKALKTVIKDVNLCSGVHLERNESHREQSLNKAFMDKKTADVIFLVDGKQIYAHRSLLQIRCQHFRNNLPHQPEAQEHGKISVTDYRYDVFRAFIEYLYTEAITIEPDDAISLMDLAHSYHEDQLKQLCVQLVERDVTEFNVASVYAAAVQYDAKTLQEFCVRYTADHMSAVCGSSAFKHLTKDLILSLLDRCRPLRAFRT